MSLNIFMRGIVYFVVLTLAWNTYGQGLMLSSTSATNAETGTIEQTDTYTRGGMTNLVRRLRILKDGTIQVRIHRIYQDGQHLADISEVLNSFSIETEANTPYYLDFEFWPDKSVKSVALMSAKNGLTDLYLGTNHVIAPVSTRDLRKAQMVGADTIELMNKATNKTPSQFHHQVKRLIEKLQE